MLVTLIPLLIILPLIAFWLWMLSDMLHNEDIPSESPVALNWPPMSKNHWIVFFIILSIAAAGYYYFTVYRNQR